MSLTLVSADHRTHLSTEEFRSRYLAGDGTPVVVTDAVEQWPARAWSFDFFRQRYGDDVVIVADTLGRPNAARKATIRDFLNYVEYPDGSALSQVPTPTPLYMNSYSPFVQHPELLDDFQEPYFIDNWYRKMKGDFADWYNQGFGWVFLGPAATVTPLHVDLFGTHAWLAQIVGRKRITLYPPSQSSYLYGGAVDPLRPNLERFPLYANATPIELVLEPGEVVFIPTGWFHHVVSLDNSISLTFNFVNESNFATHVLAISRDLPLWTKKTGTPAMRQALGIEWVCKGWEFPQSSKK